MDELLPHAVWPVLRCPNCNSGLVVSQGGAICADCGVSYPRSKNSILDLRLQKPKTVRDEVILGTPLLSDPEFVFDVMRPNSHPSVDYSGMDVPLSRTLLSYFPKAINGDALALDIGCGDVIHRSVCEHAGFKYVGLDYQTDQAPMLGDAHALPFADQSFDFILSFAVLEHIQHPRVMMKEAYRVLKKGGFFIGVVAFSEPFHQDSYYHHTHLGTYNSLKGAGFDVLKVAPSKDWRALQAHASMGLFPKMPRRLAIALVAPVDWIHRFWWWLGSLFDKQATEQVRIVRTTGCFEFVATRNF